MDEGRNRPDLDVGSLFHEKLDSIYSTQHTRGHWQSIKDLLGFLTEVLQTEDLSLLFFTPGDPDVAVEYVSTKFIEQCPRYGTPREFGLVYDKDPSLWTPDPKYLAFPVTDADGRSFGYLTTRLHKLGASAAEVRVLRESAFVVSNLLVASIARRSKRLRIRFLQGSIDSPVGTRRDPLRDRLHEVCEDVGYGSIQFWEVTEDGETAYLARDPDEYRIRRQDPWLVCQVWRNRRPAIRYTVNGNNVRFPELLPEGNQSWIGYPLERNGKVTSILSCFDRERSVRLLTVLDFAVIETLVLMITLEREGALRRQDDLRNRQSQSHEISGHLQNMRYNFRVLKRAAKGTKDSRTTAGTGATKTRSVPVILRNIESFLSLAIRSLNLEDFSDLDEYQLNLGRHNVYRCVAETVAMIRVLLRSNEAQEYHIDYDEFSDYQTFDYSALQEVVIILLFNAAKYTASSVPIRITHPRPGILRVSNIGIGVPPGDETLIFDRGKQGSNVTPDMALKCEVLRGHKGLGLHIARTILQKTGGCLELVQPGRPMSDQQRLAVHFGQLSKEEAASFYTVFEVRLKA